MKKSAISILLSVVMMLSLASCGEKKNVFSPNELTEAQSYAYSAISEYELYKGTVLLSADVLLTDDITGALPGNIITKDWEDVEGAKAIVLARYGKTSSVNGESKDENTDKKTEPTLVMAFFLNEEKEVISKITVSGANGSVSVASESSVDANDEEYDLRRALAEAELDEEKFLSEHGENEELAIFAQKAAGVGKTIEALGKRDFVTETNANSLCLVYWEKLWKCAALKAEIDRNSKIEELSGSELYDAKKKLASDKEVWEQQRELLIEYAKSAKEKSDFEAEHKEKAEILQEMHKNLENDKKDIWSDIECLKLCLNDEEINTYDIILRQQYMYNLTLDTLEEAYKEDDAERRDYIASKSTTQTTAFSEYSNAIKVYAQCVINQEKFLSDNREILDKYDLEESAAKKAAGADYENSIDYIKVQITYEDVIKQKKAHESAVKNSKKAADDILVKRDEDIKKADEQEAERIKKHNAAKIMQETKAYLAGDIKTVSEYEAEKNMWGELHPDFIAYQNNNLKYIAEKTYSGSGSKKKNSGGGGMKYDKNDKLYSKHDYDNDGKLSDSEFQDAFNDKVNQILNGQ